MSARHCVMMCVCVCLKIFSPMGSNQSGRKHIFNRILEFITQWRALMMPWGHLEYCEIKPKILEISTHRKLPDGANLSNTPGAALKKGIKKPIFRVSSRKIRRYSIESRKLASLIHEINVQAPKKQAWNAERVRNKHTHTKKILKKCKMHERERSTSLNATASCVCICIYIYIYIHIYVCMYLYKVHVYVC